MTGDPDDRAIAPGSPRDPFERVETGTLGMVVFLLTLAMLFAATMFVYILVILRLRTRDLLADDPLLGPDAAPFPDLPALPALLVVSTLLMLASSFTIHAGRYLIRSGSPGGLKGMMLATVVLGGGFLGLQVICWMEWLEGVRALIDDDAYRAYRFALWGFVVLSVIHALHVVGGLIPLIAVTIRAFANAYTPERHAGVRHLVLYWHFLDIVWIIMYATLLILT